VKLLQLWLTAKAYRLTRSPPATESN